MWKWILKTSLLNRLKNELLKKWMVFHQVCGINIINTISVQGNKNCLFFNISVLSRCINHEGAGCSCTFKYWLVFNEYPLRLTKRTQREAQAVKNWSRQTQTKLFSSYCHFQNTNLSLFNENKNDSKLINHNCPQWSRHEQSHKKNEIEQFRGTYSPRGEGIYTLTEQFPRCVPSRHQLFSMQSILRLHEGNKKRGVHKCMHVTH